MDKLSFGLVIFFSFPCFFLFYLTLLTIFCRAVVGVDCVGGGGGGGVVWFGLGGGGGVFYFVDTVLFL